MGRIISLYFSIFSKTLLFASFVKISFNSSLDKLFSFTWFIKTLAKSSILESVFTVKLLISQVNNNSENVDELLHILKDSIYNTNNINFNNITYNSSTDFIGYSDTISLDNPVIIYKVEPIKQELNDLPY